ncbi:heparinase II/III family protein [Massilia sp. BJB1822]|uniref:heparinase II/III domain-containing protein n=1 Tax=Massilia sp. BJB1822 TaxID=2744470 RepID=UPI001592CED3|nr:heparinase II/III family protein [Massilia sp. BJB1822]NVE00041.1 heparinase II/III family protein [Massilia sp. BJB1822]
MVLKTMCRVLAAAMASMLAVPALAQLPARLKSEHPRVLATVSDIDRLKQQILPLPFPTEQGSVSFSVQPKLFGANDSAYDVLFGREESLSPHRIYVKHLDGKGADQPKLLVRMETTAGVAFLQRELPLTLGKEALITLAWNSKEVSVALNGQAVGESALRPADWKPGRENFIFSPRTGETVKNVEIKGKGWDKPYIIEEIDYELYRALTNLYASAKYDRNVLRNCPAGLTIGKNDGICNVYNAGRNLILEKAKNFSLAYKLSGNPFYLDAARSYADRILQVEGVAPHNLSAGGEWAMSSRIGAMGVLYDWLGDDLGVKAESGRSYRTLMAESIKKTIATAIPPEPKRDEIDLIESTCGRGNRIQSTPTLKCSVEPIYTGWQRQPGQYTISQYYLTGHNLSALSGMAMGLIAIADENDDVLPMLNTIYQHFRLGIIPARDFVSADGGHHMGYAYNASTEIAERVMLWRKALDTADENAVLKADWLPKLVYPFIYGLRNDGSFPARGDAFKYNAGYPSLAALALSAALYGNDPVAMAFYKRQILPNRQRSEAYPLLWERLIYPAKEEGLGEHPASLSRHFATAGLVNMRDSWDYANATLLDFKSSSFISQNHHHLDQNSFSLNFKGPLLLDAGLYDDYNSRHWWNYYTRTIAHNSMLVFHEGENFYSDTGVLLSNDGGQSLGARHPYPTMEELPAPKPHWLHGITAYEDGGSYSYAKGNASRAYSAEKMDQENGFLRSIVFLRDVSRKPLILVYDSVLSNNKLKATSLLQMAKAPASSATLISAGAGRKLLQFANDGQRRLTVSNGRGMVTIDPLLPEKASIVQVGLNPGETDDCIQTPVSPSTSTTLARDCRYTARYRVGTGYEWRNYPNIVGKEDLQAADAGGWRLEISPEQAPAEGEAQYFLNVLSVTDQEAGEIAPEIRAKLLKRVGEATEAVLLANGQTVVFNRGQVPASGYSWIAERNYGAVLATGLQRGASFACVSEARSDGGFLIKLEQRADGEASSSNGVLSCTIR